MIYRIKEDTLPEIYLSQIELNEKRDTTAENKFAKHSTDRTFLPNNKEAVRKGVRQLLS